MFSGIQHAQYVDPHITLPTHAPELVHICLFIAAIEVLSEDPSIEVRESNWLRRSFRRSVRRLRKTPNSPELPKEDDIDDPTTDMTTEFVPEDHQDGPQLETVC